MYVIMFNNNNKLFSETPHNCLHFDHSFECCHLAEAMVQTVTEWQRLQVTQVSSALANGANLPSARRMLLPPCISAVSRARIDGFKLGHSTAAVAVSSRKKWTWTLEATVSADVGAHHMGNTKVK